MNPDSNFKERRKTQRFPVERDLKFRVTARKGVEESGTGRTVDMSSGGVLFTTDRLLLPGRAPGTIHQLAGATEPAMRTAAIRTGKSSAVRRRESSRGDRSPRVSYGAGALAGAGSADTA